MKHFPTTQFAREVAITEFARVCPKCLRHWNNRRDWMIETVLVGHESRNADLDRPSRHEIRSCTCGGLMLSEGV